MMFSVVLSVTGHRLDRIPWDIDLSSVVDACTSIESEDWRPDDEPSEYGASEYAYLGTEDGEGTYPAEFWINAMNIARAKGKADRDREIFEHLEGLYGSRAWWCSVSDYQASGILTREQWETLAESLGLFAEDCGTMGTLGGPLNPLGITPDIPYSVESQHLIISARATPFSEHWKMTPERWDKVRERVIKLHADCTYNKAS